MSLSNAAIEALLKKSGAERTSKTAMQELGRELEEQGKKIAERAIQLARHAGRKTVQSQDILLAAKE